MRLSSPVHALEVVLKLSVCFPRHGVGQTLASLMPCGLESGFRPLREAGNGFGFIVVNVKDGQELGYLEQILHLLGEVQQF